MIFVTVGVQLPFDRLINAVDQWGAKEPTCEVFAQTGESSIDPVHIAYKKFLDPAEYESRCKASELIVAHAGMGSILTALEYSKPLIIMPRRAEFNEHRNDHQLSTVERFKSLQSVYVALDEKQLVELLDSKDSIISSVSQGEGTRPDPRLIEALQNFVNEETS